MPRNSNCFSGNTSHLHSAGGISSTKRDTMERLISLAADGKLKPVIDRELPFEQAADAHRAIEARETFGKVILRP